MSHSKTVYVMTRWNLNKLQKHGIAQCRKCLQDFDVDDVVATSSSKRYCYHCATLINLVTGKVKNDLFNDEFILDTLHHIESIGKKLKINDDISKLAILLMKTAMERKNYVSKNESGLACASIFLAHQIKKEFISDTFLPVSKITLQKNLSSLKKNLAGSDVYVFSQRICEMQL